MTVSGTWNRSARNEKRAYKAIRKVVQQFQIRLGSTELFRLDSRGLRIHRSGRKIALATDGCQPTNSNGDFHWQVLCDTLEGLIGGGLVN
jgi:hypothetical protein